VTPLDQRQVPDEPPPFLGTWTRVYCVVLAYLAVVILLMYAFTVAFTR
jgi:hypothetical protein